MTLENYLFLNFFINVILIYAELLVKPVISYIKKSQFLHPMYL